MAVRAWAEPGDLAREVQIRSLENHVTENRSRDRKCVSGLRSLGAIFSAVGATWQNLELSWGTHRSAKLRAKPCSALRGPGAAFLANVQFLVSPNVRS